MDVTIATGLLEGFDPSTWFASSLMTLVLPIVLLIAALIIFLIPPVFSLIKILISAVLTIVALNMMEIIHLW